MSRRHFLLLPLAVASWWAGGARAARNWSVGVLDETTSRDPKGLFNLFKPGMAAIGHAEGNDLRYHPRFMENDFNRAEPLAAELVRLRPSVLVTRSTASTRALLKHTRDLPIVTICGDPVGSGFAATLSKPGGNVTGLSIGLPQLWLKQIEYFRSVLPELSELGILARKDPYSGPVVAMLETLARAQGIRTTAMLFGTSAEVAAGFAELQRRKIRAAVDAEVAPRIIDHGRYAELAIAHGVAVAYSEGESKALFLGLIEHGLMERHRTRLPYIVDKILRGARAGDIPFELPERFHLTINLRTAAALGLRVPSGLALRADELIE